MFGIVKFFVVKYFQILYWVLTPLWPVIMRIPPLALVFLLIKRVILRYYNVRKVPIVDEYEINERNVPEDMRTFEGSMNNKKKPSMGMMGCPFAINVKPLKNPPAGPEVIQLSRTLLKRRGRGKMTKLVNLIGASWAQFMIQDWFLHRLDKNKMISFDLGKEETMRIGSFAKTTIGGNSYSVNSTDHWWSCSQIYGYTKEQSIRYRTMVDGKLKLDEKGFIPINYQTGIEEVGFPRNMWSGLSLLHWLFVVEHNRVCDMLKNSYPELNTDEKIYQKARLIITAMVAKIHVVEWSTAMIQNPLGRATQYITWYGLLGTLLGTKIKMPWNGLVSSLIGGTAGNGTRMASNENYAHSEEYSAAFRMHTLIPDQIQVKSVPHGEEHEEGKTYPISEFFFSKSAEILHKCGPATLAYTLGTGRAGAIALQNHPSCFEKLSVPKQSGFGDVEDADAYMIDMGAADIFRCREMKLPLFNEFRRQYSLKPYRSFKEFTDDPELVQALNSAYGGDIERMDTYVGMMGEKQCPGFAFGETMYTIIMLQTIRRIESDRFLTCDFQKKVYTAKGMKLIEETTMSELLRRHIPELKRFLHKHDNAFIPWDVKDKRKIHERVIWDLFFPYKIIHWFKGSREIPTLTKFLPPHLDRAHQFFQDGELHCFTPRTSNFDVVNAWWLSEVCFLSYFEEPYFRKWVYQSIPSTRIQFIDNQKNTQVHVISSSDWIWVVFRGTEWWPKNGAKRGSVFKSISDDWTVDFDLQLAQEGHKEGVLVHRGFQNALNDVWSNVVKAIDMAKENNHKKIFFTGHSVGGAIATLAGYRYGKDVQAVYTFGAPAVGNSSFINDYNQTGPMTFNVCNHDDVFPKLLMPQLGHPGMYVHIYKGKLKMNQPPHPYGSSKFLGGKAKSLLDRVVVDYAVFDHSPVMYSTHLWNQFSFK